MLLWSIQYTSASVEYSGKDGAGPDLGEDGSFSWKELLKRSVSFQEMPFGEQLPSDSTRQFLVKFGETLDHCNKRIEEAAVVSEYMIKHFMATVVNHRPADDSDDEFLNRMVDESEIITENLDIPYEDINVRLLNSDSNFWPSLLNVLGVLSEACDDLPVQIVESDMAARREKIRHQTVLDDIVSAMTHWTAQWSEKVKASASVFLDDCMAVENCETNLRLIMDVLGQSLEDSLRSNSKVEALLRSYAEDRQTAAHLDEIAVNSKETSVEEEHANIRGTNSNEESINDEEDTAGHEETADSDENRIVSNEISSQKRKKFKFATEVSHHSGDADQDETHRGPSGSESGNSIANTLRLMFRDFSDFVGFDSKNSETNDSGSDGESTRQNDVVSAEINQPVQRQPNSHAQKIDNRRSMELLSRVHNAGNFNGHSENGNDSPRPLSDDENEQQSPRFSHGGQRLLRLLSASLAVLQLPWQSRQEGKVVLQIDGNQVVNTVPEEFLSFALESQLIQKPGEKFDTKSVKLRQLMQPLKNAIFRLGGSSANFLFFDPEHGIDASKEEVLKRTTPTNEDTWRSPFPKANNHGPWQPHQQEMLSRSPINKRGPWQRDDPQLNGLSNIKSPTPIEENLLKTHPKLPHSKKTQWSSNAISPPMVHPKFRKFSQERVSMEPHDEHDGNIGTSRSPRSLPIAEEFHPKLSRRTKGHFHSPYDPRPLAQSEWGTHAFHNFTLTNSDFESLLELCRALNWTLLFDVNQFTREGGGAWDSNNAKLLIAAAGRTPVIWQLGNEPNSYAHKFPFSINGTQMARDVGRLRGILNTGRPHTLGPVTLVGPDVTRPHFPASLDPTAWGNCDSDRRGHPSSVADGPLIDSSLGSDSVQFLEDFLKADPQLVDAISWHQYYVCGRTATVSDFLAPSTMDLFPRQLGAIVRVRDQWSPNTPIWLTETGSAYGGGAPGLSNRFAGTFLWMDKLGVAARGGVHVVARQSIFGGHYALLDQNYDPNPDYWVSVLHKQLLGTRVLHLTALGAPSTLRLYAHCMHAAHPRYHPGSVVIYGVNAGEQEAGVLVVGAPDDTPTLEYVLTPALGDLTARDVLLNGVLLQTGGDGSVPELLPQEATVGELRAPPHSVGFWVLQRSGVAACI
ncbi:Glycoside hydrolase family 79 [Trinorchestia longiramus]|nr:Glycoside hydrolase family 79 [Trinorchestia longiramus]